MIVIGSIDYMVNYYTKKCPSTYILQHIGALEVKVDKYALNIS